MGNFLAVTAVRSQSSRAVAEAIGQYLESYGAEYELLPWLADVQDDADARVFAPVNGWCVVLWPNFFNVHDFPLTRSLAQVHGWLISTVHVYDGDYWEHLAMNGGDELHSYCSSPGYWQDEPAEMERIAEMNPDPARLAGVLGVSGADLSRYLVDAGELAGDGEKAFADDEFELADFWVFTDFWRRLGITYPDPSGNAAAVIRLLPFFDNKLPVG